MTDTQSTSATRPMIELSDVTVRYGGNVVASSSAVSDRRRKIARIAERFDQIGLIGFLCRTARFRGIVRRLPASRKAEQQRGPGERRHLGNRHGNVPCFQVSN